MVCHIQAGTSLGHEPFDHFYLIVHGRVVQRRIAVLSPVQGRPQTVMQCVRTRALTTRTSSDTSPSAMRYSLRAATERCKSSSLPLAAACRASFFTGAREAACHIHSTMSTAPHMHAETANQSRLTNCM